VTAVHDELETGRVTRAAGFTSIVVALDLEANGDRALPVARGLAEVGGIPVALLTVSSPGVSEDADVFELRRRAAENGWPHNCCTVAHDNHPARAIVDVVERHDGALLVMATSARPPLAGHLFGNVIEEVLGAIDQPVLLVGPNVPTSYGVRRPTLVACVDDTDVAVASVPAIARWVGTFGGGETWVTKVIPTGRAATGQDGNASENVRDFAHLLADQEVPASWGVLCGDEADVRLEEFADRLSDPIFVATSVRWTDGRLHWRSATHQLVQRSTRPVLVVPAKQRAPSATPATGSKVPLDGRAAGTAQR
jgi:nucleotide-binding universal stress UspA family protein